MRYFGPRDLIEDGFVRSDSTTQVNAEIGYRFSETWSAAVQVFNLFDREDSDIDYFYTSRLRGEPEGGFDDVHFHPAEPWQVRLTVTARFWASYPHRPCEADSYGSRFPSARLCSNGGTRGATDNRQTPSGEMELKAPKNPARG